MMELICLLARMIRQVDERLEGGFLIQKAQCFKFGAECVNVSGCAVDFLLFVGSLLGSVGCLLLLHPWQRNRLW